MGTRSTVVAGIVTAVTAAGAVVGVEVAGASDAQAAQWVTYDWNGDGYNDAATMDRNGNGIVDDIWLDLDQDHAWDARALDQDESNGLMELMAFDMNENGATELIVMQYPGYDMYRYDTNDDGAWDYEEPRPYTTIGPVDWAGNPYGLFVAMAGLVGTVV